jgi:D-lactate dehydrogenase
MMGGILANNSSGMCCGITENPYRTVRAMKIVFPDGFVLDTGSPRAAEQLASEAPTIERGLKELKARLLADNVLAERVCRRYRMKNNNGYSLNAFLDFDTPLDILLHLMIGSEGTLGFIAEAVLDTFPDYPRKYTGQLYFRTVQDAARAIAPLRDSGARAAEIMDRASLRSVEKLPGAPAVVAQLPDTAAAILVEYQGVSAEDIADFRRGADSACRRLALLHDPEFTDDPPAQARLWKLRKGMIPAVGAVRRPGTTVLIEDVVFPVPQLADGITDLQSIFKSNGYDDAIIFGHAKDGNLHFAMSQSFNTPDQVGQFDAFMGDLVRVVSGKYDGALKAEHGTGRNMAPFLETEWGANARSIMRDLKALIDPKGILSPGVIINDDPKAHIAGLKSLPTVEAEVDKCIECGFCEPQCPSRRLTLTPRQRIVVRREIARLRAGGPASPGLATLLEDYNYSGIETCAADGLCALSCPVSINTGDLTRRLRSEQVGPRGARTARWIAAHYGLAERGLRTAVHLGHAAERLIGVGAIQVVTRGLERIAGTRLPKWQAAVQRVPRGLPATDAAEAEYVYFPSCISRSMGVPSPGSASLAETVVTLARRAGVKCRSGPPGTLGHTGTCYTVRSRASGSGPGKGSCRSSST